MMGDATSESLSDNTRGFSEAYVCTKGFDGTYRVLFRDWSQEYAFEYHPDAASIGGGADVVAADISPQLIEIAKVGNSRYEVFVLDVGGESSRNPRRVRRRSR